MKRNTERNDSKMKWIGANQTNRKNVANTKSLLPHNQQENRGKRTDVENIDDDCQVESMIQSLSSLNVSEPKDTNKKKEEN